MELEIREEPLDKLAASGYSGIPIRFRIASRLRVELVRGGLDGIRISEEPVEPPYDKDYDADEVDRPQSWVSRWDTSNWVLFLAFLGGELAGGAVVASRTPGLHMLEGRDDLAVLWDIRVRPEHRGRGVGKELVARAAAWARGKGCRTLKIETQNDNVAACKFYAACGCRLGGIHPGAYEASPEEVQLLWYLDLSMSAP